MKTSYFGSFINKAGKESYKTPESVENLIRYITRTNRNPKHDLVAWGGAGILECAGIGSIIRQFELAREMNGRCNSQARFIDHEIFSFTKEGEALLAEGNVDLDRLARELASDFYEKDGCQAVYGVHAPDGSDKHLHIHFAVNTFDCITGSKRRENMGSTKERETRFQQVIAARVREGLA